MKYKVGDRVKIKSLDWYNDNKNQLGRVNCGSKSYTIEMCFFCGKILTIQAIGLDFYLMEEDNWGYEFTDEMIECKVEEEIREVTDKYYWEMLGGKSTKEINLPDGYIFKDENGNVISATKIVLEKKKKEYPNTYEECLKVLGYDDRETYCVCHTGADERLFEALYRLKVCRDAYWKIAGEEMGLGKPWKPNDSSGYCTYAILRHTGHIRKSRPCADSALFEFPTEEMRDAFKENFKELIEQCKELL